MALKPTTAKEAGTGGGEDFELAPAGQHYAMCVGVIDLGLQEEEYGGEVKEKHKLAFVFELLEPSQKDGKPFLFADRFTVSLAANGSLRPFLGRWLGRTIKDGENIDFTATEGPDRLIGRYAYVTVEHLPRPNGPKKDFAKMTSVMQVPQPLRDEARTLKPRTQPIVWEIEEAELPPFAEDCWLFGKKLADVIGLSKERRGQHPSTNQVRRAPKQPLPPKVPAAVVPSTQHKGAVLVPGTGISPPRPPSPAELARQNAAAMERQRAQIEAEVAQEQAKEDTSIPF